MRTASSGLAAHFAQETTTLAWLWKVTRRDGQVFGFTTHDLDLTIAGVMYSADSGFAATAAQSRLGASVDNLDITGAIEGEVITEADILAGVWDGAAVVVSMVNWADITQGVAIIHTGTMGNIQATGTAYTAEMRSLSQSLQSTVGRVITRRCNADLGDSRCGVDMGTRTISGSVSADSTDWQVFTGTSIAELRGGLLTWTAGANTGTAMEIKAATTSVVTLFLPMPHAIVAGDTYTATTGCDKNLSTCRDFYDNVINFRGFPFIPGPDAILAYPDAS